MNYSQEYKSFVNSQYFSEGLRITTGVLLPAFFFAYINQLALGIVISLGSLIVSVNDGPGPSHHRRNGMLICTAFIFICTLVTGLLVKNIWALGVFLAIACFFFSMTSVYGPRAGGIGTGCMIVIAITIDPRNNLTNFSAAASHALYVAAGGLWFTCFSLLLQNFRPFRPAQQALGDLVQETADYLLARSQLYKRGINYDETFKKILQQQVIVQQKQNDVSELLFKTRSIIKESTIAGRTLVMILLDVTDMFEKISQSHQKYQLLHDYFDPTDVLDDMHHLLQKISHELNMTGIAIKSGEPCRFNNTIEADISRINEKIEKLRAEYLKPDNIEGFIGLRKIVHNVDDLVKRLKRLDDYSTYDERLTETKMKAPDFDKMISGQKFSLTTFTNNLSFQSDTFRHSIRVSLAIVTGFVVAHALKIGHSYWVLLTIVVILKPAYSLTQKRNGQRLAGTTLGVAIGVVILQLTSNSHVLLALLIILMAASYMSMRKNYFLSVLLMTPYLVLFYHLLSPGSFNTLLKDRVIDTATGSVIAFFASLFIFPSWEKNKIKPVMSTALKEVNAYFQLIIEALKGRDISLGERQLARKNAMVALANLSDAFTRMLSEPKNQQTGVEKLHQLVVLLHMFASYISTLTDYASANKQATETTGFLEVAEDVKQLIEIAIRNLNSEFTADSIAERDSLRKLDDLAAEVLEQRKKELAEGNVNTPTRKILFDIKSIVDQFALIYNAAQDIYKVTASVAKAM